VSMSRAFDVKLDITKAAKAAGIRLREVQRLLGPDPLFDTEPPDWLDEPEDAELWMKGDDCALPLKRIVSTPGVRVLEATGIVLRDRA
jgi:hypothetical protein